MEDQASMPRWWEIGTQINRDPCESIQAGMITSFKHLYPIALPVMSSGIGTSLSKIKERRSRLLLSLSQSLYVLLLWSLIAQKKLHGSCLSLSSFVKNESKWFKKLNNRSRQNISAARFFSFPQHPPFSHLGKTVGPHDGRTCRSHGRPWPVSRGPLV